MKFACFKTDLLTFSLMQQMQQQQMMGFMEIYVGSSMTKWETYSPALAFMFTSHLFRLKDSVHPTARKQGSTISEFMSWAQNARQNCGHWRDKCCQILCIGYLPDSSHLQFPELCQQPSSLGQAHLLCLLLPDHGSTAACSLWAAAAKAIRGSKWIIHSAADCTLEELAGN